MTALCWTLGVIYAVSTLAVALDGKPKGVTDAIVITISAATSTVLILTAMRAS